MADKKTAKLTGQRLRQVVREAIDQTLCEGGRYFNHGSDEFGRDYFEDARRLASTIGNLLNTMDDEKYSDDHTSIAYLYKQLSGNVSELGRLVRLMGRRIGGDSI